MISINHCCCISSGLSAIHFRGSTIRQVSCYTLLSGCRLPWPPSCCLYRVTLFVESVYPHLGTLTTSPMHLVLPVLLTNTSPLGLWDPKNGSIKQPPSFAHLEFESRWRTFCPPLRQSFALPHKTPVFWPAILREISVGTSYQVAR